MTARDAGEQLDLLAVELDLRRAVSVVSVATKTNAPGRIPTGRVPERFGRNEEPHTVEQRPV